MSFLSSAFSGASNNYAPGGGNAQQSQQITQDNQNLASANSGLNSLAGMLTQQAQGTGPNLANAQLQSATAQNIGNQAALMAGQRGASANPALMARQVAQQGAGIQQQAAGQSAQNVLAQQIAAQQQLGNVYSTQGSLANQNYSAVQGGISDANKIGAGIAGQNAQMNQGLIGGVGNVVGKIAGFADGGSVNQQEKVIPGFGSGSNFGFNFVSMQKPQTMAAMNAGIPQAAQSVLGANPQQIPDPTQQNYSQGGSVLPFMPMNLKQGGPVQARAPQEQAQVSGNSLKNDKIPAMVSEGEIVLPRDVAMSSNAPTLAAQFVAAVKAGKHK